MTYLGERLRHIAGELINGTVEDGAVECGLLCAAADEIDRLEARVDYLEQKLLVLKERRSAG